MAELDKVKLSYRIKKIQTINFSFVEINKIDFESLVENPNGMGINIDVSLAVNADHKEITIDVSTKLFVTEDNNVLVAHTARTGFYVEGLAQVQNKEQNSYDLPIGFSAQIIGIAYTHARALLSVEISPTVYRDGYFLPVIDPMKLLPKQMPKISN